MDPQPDYSAFREASYGHSTLEIKNRTHAVYHWNRNDDGKKVATDSFLLHNQHWLVQRLFHFFYWSRADAPEHITHTKGASWQNMFSGLN